MNGYGENRYSGFVLTDNRMDAKEYSGKIEKIGGKITEEVADAVEIYSARVDQQNDMSMCQG